MIEINKCENGYYLNNNEIPYTLGMKTYIFEDIGYLLQYILEHYEKNHDYNIIKKDES